MNRNILPANFCTRHGEALAHIVPVGQGGPQHTEALCGVRWALHPEDSLWTREPGPGQICTACVQILDARHHGALWSPMIERYKHVR